MSEPCWSEGVNIHWHRRKQVSYRTQRYQRHVWSNISSWDTEHYLQRCI